jgi:hypothetical protein
MVSANRAKPFPMDDTHHHAHITEADHDGFAPRLQLMPPPAQLTLFRLTATNSWPDHRLLRRLVGRSGAILRGKNAAWANPASRPSWAMSAPIVLTGSSKRVMKKPEITKKMSSAI